MTWALVFAQHALAGMVTRAIVLEAWAAVFVLAMLQQAIWWINMGLRIDRHGSRAAAVAYTVVSAAGLALGAWAWR